MEKLRFEFTLLPASDGKSNTVCVTSISTNDCKVYAVPEEFQPISFHEGILRTSIYNKVKNSLKKRYQTRRVWITMTEELKAIYVDESGNIQFADQFLEEINGEKFDVVQQAEANTLTQLYEKLVGHSQEIKQQNLKQVAEKFVIEKFTTKNSNANHWIDIFEQECKRFDITTDENKIEILRLFMDKSCMDWYSSMVIKLTLNSEWSVWKNKFSESFASKGWNPVTYALLFRYKEGSLLDYAIKKERLLLDMRRSIDSGTLVDLVAAGLPEFVLNRIDREALGDTVDLFNEVSKYEHLVNRRSFLVKNRVGNVRNTNERNPCKICDKLNKGNRYHPETACWFRTKEDDKLKKNYIKHVNNSVVEAELNETCQKN